MTRLAVIGAGKLGEALIAGVLRSGWDSADISVVEADAARAGEVVARYGVRSSETVAGAVADADVVLVCVKPQHTGEVADEIARAGGSACVVSVAAGVSIAAYEARLPAGTAVVRVMPNTPALLGQAMSAISPGTAAGPADLDIARQIFAAVGQVVQVPEGDLDAVTAISGSGPAYFFLLAQHLIDSAVALGLTPDVAAGLVVQTAYGAAAMLRDSGQDPVALRVAVTSPGGTTAAALAQFGTDSDGELARLVRRAVTAARDRSVEMGKDQT